MQIIGMDIAFSPPEAIFVPFGCLTQESSASGLESQILCRFKSLFLTQTFEAASEWGKLGNMACFRMVYCLLPLLRIGFHRPMNQFFKASLFKPFIAPGSTVVYFFIPIRVTSHTSILNRQVLSTQGTKQRKTFGESRERTRVLQLGPWLLVQYPGVILKGPEIIRILQLYSLQLS